MKLIEIKLPPEFESDGCTFPFLLAIFKRVLGGKKYKEYCKEHDFLRRYGVIPWFKSNLLLGKRIAEDGVAGKIRAPFYIIFTTISYPFYSGTLAKIDEWEEYYARYDLYT